MIIVGSLSPDPPQVYAVDPLSPDQPQVYTTSYMIYCNIIHYVRMYTVYVYIPYCSVLHHAHIANVICVVYIQYCIISVFHHGVALC